MDQNVEPRQKVQQLERQRLAPAEEGGLGGESQRLLERIKTDDKTEDSQPSGDVVEERWRWSVNINLT